MLPSCSTACLYNNAVLYRTQYSSCVQARFAGAIITMNCLSLVPLLKLRGAPESGAKTCLDDIAEAHFSRLLEFNSTAFWPVYVRICNSGRCICYMVTMLCPSSTINHYNMHDQFVNSVP